MPSKPDESPGSEDDLWYPRTQSFDVVILRKSVNTVTAKPEDFQRVQVRADSVAEAEGSPEVAAALGKGFIVHKSVPPGYTTEAEVDARRREHEERHGTGDRSKI